MLWIFGIRKNSSESFEIRKEELKEQTENLEVDMTSANQQYRERLLRQGVHEQEGGYEEQERERTDDDTAIGEALGKLKKR